MKPFIRALLGFIQTVMTNTVYRRASYLALLCLIMVADVAFSRSVRRTFVYPAVSNGRAVVEDRSVRRRFGVEKAVSLYVEEALLGPESGRLKRLFAKDARVESVICRKGMVYIDLSQEAAIPVEGDKDVRRSIETLQQGIRRNFVGIRQVYVFIGGEEPYRGDVKVGEANRSA